MRGARARVMGRVSAVASRTSCTRMGNRNCPLVSILARATGGRAFVLG
jgi:hypothetical protein